MERIRYVLRCISDCRNLKIGHDCSAGVLLLNSGLRESYVMRVYANHRRERLRDDARCDRPAAWKPLLAGCGSVHGSRANFTWLVLGYIEPLVIQIIKYY